jgi:hypothetical protein
MELIGFNGTTLTTLFNLAQREGAPPVVESAKALIERYDWRLPPKLEELFTDKIVFQHGVFQEKPIDAFEIYADGLVVRGRCDSDVLDAFVDDVTDWFVERTNSKKIETRSVSKTYESNLTIIGSDKMLSVLAPLARVGQLISAGVESATNAAVEYHSFGFSLAIDETAVAGVHPGPFRIERKLASEFGRNIFVTVAPLRTKDHIKVLESLER